MKTIERKNLSKTPAPKVDRIKGSSKNPKGSASSTESANKINLSDSIITTLENKREEYNEKHPNNKVALGTLKAVFRRGSGAYSTSHRPTISGGRPNSRSAWAFARVNKFLLKKGGTKVKKAYVQDDDLMEKGAILDSSCKKYISQNESIFKTGYYLNLNEFSSMIDPYGQIPLNLNYTLVTYYSGNQDGLSLIDTINPINLQNELAEILNIPLDNVQVVVGLYIKMGKKLEYISQIEGDNILLIDRDKIVCKSGKYDDLMEEGGDLGQEIICRGCGWRWNTNQSDVSDKYVCHKCGFDNRTFYDSDPIGKYETGGETFSEEEGLYIIINNVTQENRYKGSYKKIFDIIEDSISLYNPYGTDYEEIKGSDLHIYITPRPDSYIIEEIRQIKNVQIVDSDVPKYHLGGDMSKHLAPNGKPSNLTHEQWHLVRTPEFKSWFGDWENDPENASKVVDENGEPMVVYRGMPKKRKFGNIFNYNVNLFKENRKKNKFAFYFSRTKEEAERYGFQSVEYNDDDYIIKEYFLKINNLFIAVKKDSVASKSKININSSRPNRFTLYEKPIPEIDKELGKGYLTFKELFDLAKPNKKDFELLNNEYTNNKDAKKEYEKEQIRVNSKPIYSYFIDILTNDKKQDFWRNYLKDIKKYDGLMFYEDTHALTFIGKGKNEKAILEFLDNPNTICVFEPNQIKLADGSNTTFDANNPDIRYAEGGKLKKPHTVIEIAEKHEVEVNKVIKALEKGIKKEKEHTTDYTTARTIALHHLWESPKYYDKLKKMEKELNIDEHYQDLKKIYAIGGTIDPTLSFATPSGEPSKLTYLQQVLVRTSAFKNWFGDWESSAIQFIANGRQNYDRLFKNVSKVIDKVTFEPKVVYHGTRTEKEFFIFDVSKEMGVGRPYGYFAHNIEYSQNFTTSSQRGAQNSIPILYQCFINVKNPFYAMGNEYVDQRGDGKYWKDVISMTVTTDKYPNESDKDRLDKIKNVIVSQIGTYIDKIYEYQDSPFWLLMARDENKIFKYFLNNYKYDGVFYTEEIGYPYDIDNPAQFTEAVTIFEPSQVKLADGRNLNFDPMNNDIRYEDGGRTELPQNRMENFQHSSKIEKMRNLLTNSKYAEGGEVVANKLKDGNDGKKGGYFEGRSHAEGGIKAYNKDTGQMIEVEGEEVIITKGAVKDPQKREFEGEMLTNREILSRINQSGGGVSFAKGGEMESHKCGCSGKKYKYGGEMMDDYTIIKLMNQPFEIISTNFESARQFADMLVEKLK